MIRLPMAVIGLILLFVRCEKDEPIPGFDMVYQQEFTMPAGLGPFVTHHFYLKNLSSRYQALLTQNNKKDSEVVGIQAAQANITGIFGDANFDVVEEASMRVYKESDPTDYIEVAYRFPTPIDPSNSLDLIPSLADCKRFMSADRFSIDLALRLRGTTPTETDVRLNLKFKANY